MQLLSHYMQLFFASAHAAVLCLPPLQSWRGQEGYTNHPAPCQRLLAQRTQLSLCHTTYDITVTAIHMLVLHELCVT